MYILVFLLTFVVAASPCYAYLDGGASNLLLQLLCGGVAGGLVLLRVYFRKLISFIKPTK